MVLAETSSTTSLITSAPKLTYSKPTVLISSQSTWKLGIGTEFLTSSQRRLKLFWENISNSSLAWKRLRSAPSRGLWPSVSCPPLRSWPSTRSRAGRLWYLGMQRRQIGRYKISSPSMDLIRRRKKMSVLPAHPTNTRYREKKPDLGMAGIWCYKRIHGKLLGKVRWRSEIQTYRTGGIWLWMKEVGGRNQWRLLAMQMKEYGKLQSLLCIEVNILSLLCLPDNNATQLYLYPKSHPQLLPFPLATNASPILTNNPHTQWHL